MRERLARIWASGPARAVRRHLRERRWLLLVAAIVAAGGRLRAPSPPPRTVEGVADMLGASVGGKVGADDFVWEERGGFFHDALIGRRVLFLAAPPGGPADLYRAEVRLTHAGRPVGVRVVRDLTSTRAGDERQLVAAGRWVAFETVYAGGVQALSLLDLTGDYAAREARTPAERLRASVEAWLATGSVRGLGRRDVVFAAPPKSARVEVGDAGMLFALGDDGAVGRLDPATGALDGAIGDPHRPRAIAVPHEVGSWGPLAVALAAHAGGDALASPVRALARIATRVAAAARRPGAHPPSVAATSAGPGGWPPALDATRGQMWAPAGGGDGNAALQRAEIWPDADDPVKVELLAIDSRQLDLVPVAGTRRPHPATGARGAGVVPHALAPSAIAVVAAGRPEGAGEAGLVEPGGRVVVPLAAAPTFAVDRHGAPLATRASVDLATIDAAWQTRATLVDRGAPALASIAHADAPRDRAALGVTPEGHWIVAWGHDVRAGTLARALGVAHVVFAVHLADGAPVGAATLATSPDGLIAAALPLASPSIERAAWGAADDFFAVVRRDTRPAGVIAWAPDGAKQPDPAWLPSIHAAESTVLGAQVHLTAFAPGRFDWRMRAGSRETAPVKDVELPQKLAPDEAARASAAIGLGFGRRKAHRGLAFDGAVVRPFRDGGGVLAASRAGAVRVERSEGFAPKPDEDAAELPLVADGGKLLKEGSELGSMRPRAAACVLEDGTVILALTTFDSDEATTRALLDAGCARAVALDRGAHATAFVSRAGGPAAPEPQYDTTTVYALARPTTGRVRLLP